MAENRSQSAIVASVGADVPTDPQGRFRIEHIDSASALDYAAYADCIVLEEPGGGLSTLESLRESQVPTVLYDRTADPAIAERATRLGVTEYVAGLDGGRRLYDRIAAVVGIGADRRRSSPGSVRGQQTPTIRALSEAKAGLQTAETREEIATIAAEAAGQVTEIDTAAVQLFDGDGATTAVAGSGDQPSGAAIGFDEETIESALGDDGVLLGDGSGASARPATAAVSIGDRGVLSAESKRGTIGRPNRRLLSTIAIDAESALDRLDRCRKLSRHEALHETADQFAFVVSGGEIEFATRALLDRFGIADRFVGAPVGELFEDGDLLDRYDSATGNDDPVTVETAIRTDGGMYPITVELSTLDPESDSNGPGASDGLLGIVSERARHTDAESASADADADRFRHLFDRLSDAVIDVEFVDGVPIIRRVNEAFEETFGYEESSVRGATLDESIVPEGEKARAERLDEASPQSDYETAEIERLTEDGTRTFLFRGFGYRDGESRRGFGIYTDITGRLEEQRRLRVLHRVLKHNLRNEMTAIAGYADILAENAGSQEAKEQAEKIYDRATNVSELGEQVRRIEQALDIDRQPSPLDPERLVEEIVGWFQSNVSETAIRIDADGDSRIVADELLKIAVENLLENAIEHHPDAPTVEIEIRTVDDTWVDISIADDGPGIPEREQAVVSGDRRITQLDHSMGLGLWISRWIVRGIDGRFLFGDCEDGAEVILRLPRADEGTDAE